MKKLLIAAALIVSTSATAYADFENVSISFDSSSLKINVSGEVTEQTANKPVKLIVLRPGAEQITADAVFAVNEKYTKNRKDFDFCENIPQDAAGGKYIVILQSPGSGIYRDEVMYMTSGFFAETLNALDAAAESGIAEWIENNAEYFELDRTKAYEKYRNLSEGGIKSVLKTLAETDFSVAEDTSNLQEKIKLLGECFENAVIIAEANDIGGAGIDAIKEFMSEYADKLVVKESIDKKAKKLGQTVTDSLLLQAFSEELQSLDEILERYYDAVILYSIKATGHWSEVAEIFDDEADILTVNKTLAAGVGGDDLYKAYLELVGREYSSVEAAVTAFDKACEKVIADKKSTSQTPAVTRPTGGSGGSGGSGGGNGGGVGVVFTPAATPEPADDIKEEEMFTDLADAQWAKEYINELARQKVISGYGDGRFGPQDNVTRGQFAKILVNAFGLVSEDAKSSFADVSDGHIFKSAVDTVYTMNIVYGISDDLFGIDDDISREDVCTIICRAFESLGFKFDGSALDFADADEISDYARDKVALMSALGIISGDNGSFRPKNSITRAELSRIICISIEKITAGSIE